MPGPVADAVWDTTGPRHLAVAGRLDLLVAVTGLVVARPVADPADPYGEDLLRHEGRGLSELAAAERRLRRRHELSGDAEDFRQAVALGRARSSPDLRVLDLTPEELGDMEVLASRAFADRIGLTVPLGRGERATLAVAYNRDLVAGLDDGAARRAAVEWRVPVMTTQDLLRRAAAALVVTAQEAETVNRTLLDGGFYGQPTLWSGP